MFNQTLTLMWILTWCFMIFLEDVDVLFKHLCAGKARVLPADRAAVCSRRSPDGTTCLAHRGWTPVVLPEVAFFRQAFASVTLSIDKIYHHVMTLLSIVYHVSGTYISACTCMYRTFVYRNVLPCQYHHHGVHVWHCITVSPSITTYCCSMPILDETWMWHSKCKTCVSLHSFLQKTNTRPSWPSPSRTSGNVRKKTTHCGRQSSAFDPMMWSQTSGLTSEIHRYSPRCLPVCWNCSNLARFHIFQQFFLVERGQIQLLVFSL